MNAPWMFLVLSFLLGTIPLARAADWTTTDGKTYKNVTVTKLEADCVTILYDGGGARIELSKLPPELQKRFRYDPAKAQVAADKRAVTEAEDAQALEAEREQAVIVAQEKQKELIDDEAREAARVKAVKEQDAANMNAAIRAEQVAAAEDDLSSMLHPAIGAPKIGLVGNQYLGDPVMAEQANRDLAIIRGTGN